MKNIAVSCAWLLNQRHNVSVFEKNDTIGGHTATVDVTVAGAEYAIDTGFIVFNDKTYPHFIALLERLGVKRQPSEMSFSVCNSLTGLEYNGHTINTLFAQRVNLLRPKFWRLLMDIVRFNKTCKQLYDQQAIDEHTTLGQFLQQQRFSDYFAEHYILPMGAAIWSTSLLAMKEFQLAFFVRFFNHHGLLNIQDRPQWYVIPGGSREYIAPLTRGLKQPVALNSNIVKVLRNEQGVTLLFEDQTRHFDEVVFACHANQALALLGDASEAEQQVLGALPFTANDVVLHTDESMLPKNRRAWASWNYRLDHDQHKLATLTYNMNILQGIKAPTTFCVSLNQTDDIDAKKILRRFTYHHPVFDLSSEAARKKRDTICGVNNTHFVGAYWYNGFHEDGVLSAIDVAKRFDCQLDRLTKAQIT
jgi:predicted NAD/FAD-binding protein